MSRTIGPYEVLSELGRGAVGIVHEVRHPQHPGRLALKQILAAAAGPEALVRFEREARLLARVSHGNVVKIHTLGQDETGTSSRTLSRDRRFAPGATRGRSSRGARSRSCGRWPTRSSRSTPLGSFTVT